MSRAIAVALFALIALTASTLSAEANSDSYTVQDGDTLLAIATKVGVPADQLLDWVSSTVSLNGLTDADNLKLGQVLKLPPTGSSSTVSQTTSSSSSSSSTSTKPVIAGTGATYTAVDGDTLLGIAGKFSVPTDQQLTWVQSILSMNSMASPDQLALGQVLNLPGSAAKPAASASTASTTSSSSTTSTSGATPSAPTSTSTTSTSALGAAGTSTTSTSTNTTPGVFSGPASSYADYFTGRPMGCTGAGPYNPTDVTIVAVGPAMYDQFPCGTPLEICGPKACINAVRKDACPGCTKFVVDLSKAGLAAVCGPTSCNVRVRRPS